MPGTHPWLMSAHAEHGCVLAQSYLVPPPSQLAQELVGSCAAEAWLQENIRTVEETLVPRLKSLNPSRQPGRLPWLLPSPALSFALRLATEAVWAVLTDSSHQPMRFPLPQTVTFTETSLLRSGREITRMSTPRGHSPGFQDLRWQVCCSQ